MAYFEAIIPFCHVFPFVMEMEADMFNTIFPVDKFVPAEATPSREVTLHREMRIPHIFMAWNVRMNMVEMLQEVLFPMV
jgi:hypothetical protein